MLSGIGVIFCLIEKNLVMLSMRESSYRMKNVKAEGTFYLGRLYGKGVSQQQPVCAKELHDLPVAHSPELIFFD